MAHLSWEGAAGAVGGAAVAQGLVAADPIDAVPAAARARAIAGLAQPSREAKRERPTVRELAHAGGDGVAVHREHETERAVHDLGAAICSASLQAPSRRRIR